SCSVVSRGRGSAASLTGTLLSGGQGSAPRCCGVSSMTCSRECPSLSARTTAREIACSSSRTLPGHGCFCSHRAPLWQSRRARRVMYRLARTRFTGCGDHGARDRMFQFAHVARPWMLLQPQGTTVAKPQAAQAELALAALQEESGQLADVAVARAQWWHGERI